jgi:maltose alpha-D-glucosyltransferase/alpha-amylase
MPEEAAGSPVDDGERVDGCSESANSANIRWLESRSMLRRANDLTEAISGNAIQWRNAYGRPDPKGFIRSAPVWLTSYPRSLITPPDKSVVQTLGEPGLLSTLHAVGVRGIHVGPMKRSGGVSGHSYTPSIDGFFDRIELSIDPLIGTDEQYEEMTRCAEEVGIAVIGDLIPAHTGKGPDFRLAELSFKDYPGMYTMVEIDKSDWGLLGEVPTGSDSVNLSVEVVTALREIGYIPGQLEVTPFFEPGVKDTNWSATDVVTGVDGVDRRWVYLHVFKAGQPSLNWLDPSFAAQRVIMGDVVQSLHVWGDAALRLDASPLLGVEMRRQPDVAWIEGHPLAEGGSNMIAMMIRKLGGYSFQEINAGLEHLKRFSTWGPDLSYDFVTRPPYLYAMATGDAKPLRLVLRLMLKEGLDPGIFVHALQNHDELMFDLAHLRAHGDEEFRMGDRVVRGRELYEDMYAEAKHVLGEVGIARMPEFSNLGFCGTLVGYAAACCGVDDPTSMTAEQRDQVQQLHLLAAFFNAMQPGVLALSGWDLVGALPLATETVASLPGDTDLRWINRGAYDLMNTNPEADTSLAGVPKAAAVYGSLPAQLRDPTSFTARLQHMLRARAESGIALTTLASVGEPIDDGLLVMLLRRSDGGWIISALNFAKEPVNEHLYFPEIDQASGRLLYSTEPDTTDGIRLGDHGRVSLRLGPRHGQIFAAEPPRRL